MGKGPKMDQQKRAHLEQKLFDDWQDRWLAKGYFDPENPTMEQNDDWYYAYVKAFPPKKGTRAWKIANMTKEELAEFRKSPRTD